LFVRVIDNLDQVDIVKEYLPGRAHQKHTVITTRSPDTKGIPARGLEIELPGIDESLQLLYTLAEVDIESQREEASKLVE